MNTHAVLFIQGGRKGAYKADKKLAKNLQFILGEEYKVYFPKMPGENDPDYEKYKVGIEETLQKIKTKTIIVGHSLGSCFILKYITENKNPISFCGMFLVATPFWGEGGWQYEGFTIDNELASKITSTIPIFFYQSTDDETVPFSHLALYEWVFPHATFRTFIGAGHQLNNDLSKVAEDIKRLKF